MSLTVLIPMIISVLMAIAKGIWGTDKALETNVVNTGSSLDPEVLARLKKLIGVNTNA
jgi:hypothetical protein